MVSELSESSADIKALECIITLKVELAALLVSWVVLIQRKNWVGVKVANRGQNGRAVEVNVPCCRDISTKVCVIKSSSPPSSTEQQSLVECQQPVWCILHNRKAFIVQVGCQQFNLAASTILKLCAAHYKGSVLRSTLDKSCDWAWGWGIRCLCRCHGLAPKLAPSPPPLPPSPLHA